MMDYSIVFEGTEYPLPKYSIKIAEDLDAVETVCQSNVKFREKCKKMYDVISKILGKENLVGIVGEFNDVEPNKLNLVYLMLITEYSRPVDEFRADEIHNKLSSMSIDKITQVASAVTKAKN